MDRFATFAALAAETCALVQEGASCDLQGRVEGLARLLPRVHADALALPALPSLPAPPPVPYGADWPGLGRFDEGSGLLSTPLLEVVAWLQAGLVFWEEGDMSSGIALWAGGWPTWSAALADILGPLHRAALRFREKPASPRSAKGAPVVMLGPGAQHVPVSVAAPAPAIKPALGVRFEAIGLGAWIREVHERSPAAGLLTEGDVVLEVDGHSLEHVDPGVLAARMVGPVGIERAYVVYRDGVSRVVRFAAVDVEALRGG